ncbi:ATP-binding protein [Youngiibacter multivorans]|uniref:AAA+ superfamily ATPase n=1 Tax=Youngiibacter multivorans TaxID=937251 RepID=A0ABS4G466_9CLOT|nr:ATP-binding protein [Youngiibacter multivorans]MBP1919334.1 putative AAA+ superfamily ATPase [Youngiibacter multivorans]
MRLIYRETYLNRLISLKGTPDIKVITGVRRSGKSKLLEEYIEWIRENETEPNIIYIDLTHLKFEELKEYHALNNYIEDRYQRKKQNYIFIDEVQMCGQFELTINSLHSTGKYDIYVTGSNAFLLSSDLATLFTGRTYEIEVYPFSFSEYLRYYKISDIQTAFDRYMKEGGMSGSYLYKEQEEKYKYLADIFDTLILRDIRQKYKIRNIVLMNKIAEFMMDNISNLTSSRKIADTLTKNTDKINHKTVGSYLDYLCNAFAFYKVKRYDIRGKKYLTSNEKYYLSDHAFRYAKLGTRNLDYGRVMENIVAVELMRRGYEIYVGVLYKKEIDFVAVKQNEKIYIQVSDDISRDETFAREVDSLLKIKDAYPKLLIARTRHEQYQYEGIQVIDIAEWLIK